MNNYVLNDEIGQGSFSTIYKGRYRSTTEFYAIASIDKKRRERVVNCVQMLRSLHHPNIIEFHNWYETNNHLWIITELCNGGDMGTVLKSNVQLKSVAVQTFARDIAVGLMYVHSKGLIYNDLQTRNLLLDSTATLRFHDFSLCCSFADAKACPVIGTPQYMAPEFFIGDHPLHSIASDLWSLGCVIYELATGKPLFDASDLDTLLTDIITRVPPRVPGSSDAMDTLLRGLLEKDPLQRFTWADVVRSEFWDEPLTVPPGGFRTQPAFEEMRRSRSGSGRGTVWKWSDREVQDAVASAVAAAKANASVHSVDNNEKTAGILNVAKELNFTSSTPRPSVPAVARSGERASRSADNGGASSRAPSAAGSLRRGRGSDATTPSNGPQRRRGSKSRSDGGGRTAAGAAAYTGGRAAFTANASTVDDTYTESQLSVFGGGAIQRIPLDSILAHQTDQHIRPLSNNSRIEYTPDPACDRSKLSFVPLSSAEINRLSEAELASYIRTIYRAVSDKKSSNDVTLNTMNYLVSVCSNAEIAKVLVNSSMMSLCVKLAGRQDTPSTFRATAAFIMGLLVRTTVYIGPEVATSTILVDIMDLFEAEKEVTVQRKLLACIGEFLFYVAVQPESERKQWNVNTEKVQRTFSMAMDISDDILNHYAAKMIENAASTPQKEMAVQIFAYPQIVEKLLAIFALPQVEGRSEYMRSAAICAAFKLAMLRDDLILTIMQSKVVPVPSYAELLKQSSVAHTTQLWITFLNHALLKGLVTIRSPFVSLWSKSQEARSSLKTLLKSSLTEAEAEEVIGNVLFTSEDLLEQLSETISQTSVAVYGKLLLFVLLICCVGGSTICHLFNTRNVSFLDRLLRDPDAYVQQCGSSLVSILSWFVAEKLSSVARRVSSTTTPMYLNSILQLMGSAAIRSKAEFRPVVFQHLSSCIDKAMNNSIYGMYENDFNTLADRFVESSEVVMRYKEPICTFLVSTYTEMLRRKDSSRQFTAVRFLVSAMGPISAECAASKTELSYATAAAKQLLSSLASSMSSLLQETSPIPTNAMRLITTCGEIAPKALAPLATESLIGAVMEHIAGSDVDLFYPFTFIQQCLSVAPQTELLSFVLRQNLCTLVMNTLQLATEKSMDQMLEVCCTLLALLLRRATAERTLRMSQQCATCVQSSTIHGVLLPICADAKNSVAVVEAAASAIEDLVSISPVAKADVLSTRGVSLLVIALVSALAAPVNVSAAESLIRTAQVSCEGRKRPELQMLSRNGDLMAVLRTASNMRHLRGVASDASKVIRALSD